MYIAVMSSSKCICSVQDGLPSALGGDIVLVMVLVAVEVDSTEHNIYILGK